jgi:hypothetical protein
VTINNEENKIHLHVDSNSICMISIIQNILLYCSDTGLILSYDAGWQKRGSGRNYNSLSGILYFELWFMIIDWLVTVLRLAREFFTNETLLLPVKRCKILAFIHLAQGLWTRRGRYHVFPVSFEGPPMHLLASYDTQGNVEDLFLPESSQVFIMMNEIHLWWMKFIYSWMTPRGSGLE